VLLLTPSFAARRRSASAWRWSGKEPRDWNGHTGRRCCKPLPDSLLASPVALFCVRYVKSQLYEITSVNASVMVIAIGVLVLTAAIAGIIPARRAASIDPARALRIE